MKDNRRDFIKKSAAMAAAVSVTGIGSYEKRCHLFFLLNQGLM